MECLRIWNTNNNELIAQSAQKADRFFSRLNGLLGRSEFLEGEALIIYPCDMVHSIGMKFAIDVAFLDREYKVLYIINNMVPQRISPRVKNARYVLELPAGKLRRSRTQPGNVLKIEAVENNV